MKKALLILAAAIGATFPVLAQKKIRVGILDFQAGQGVAPGDAKTIADIFRSEMVGSEKYLVLERGKMDQILGEQGFQKTGCTETECAVQIGKILNMEKMLFGNVSKLGTKLYVIVSMVNIETSEIDKVVKKSIESYDYIEQACSEMTAEFDGKKVVSKIPQKQPAQPAYTPPPVYAPNPYGYGYIPPPPKLEPMQNVTLSIDVGELLTIGPRAVLDLGAAPFYLTAYVRLAGAGLLIKGLTDFSPAFGPGFGAELKLFIPIDDRDAFYFGPAVEFGWTDETTEDYLYPYGDYTNKAHTDFMFLGGRIGYRWRFEGGFIMDIGAMGGVPPFGIKTINTRSYSTTYRSTNNFDMPFIGGVNIMFGYEFGGIKRKDPK
jgi:hypothetical protein